MVMSPSADGGNRPKSQGGGNAYGSTGGGGGGGGGGVDFSSDVGRKRFGFSHEEIDDAFAYYEGQFKLFQRCGHGTLHSPVTGAKYVGQFMGDQFHGKGDQVWPDGSTYSGSWRNGRKHGHGKYTNAEGLTFEGQWEDGRRHGQGVQNYGNNDTYAGWWFHGLCSGLGAYHFADGSRYEGAWAHGRYDGPGMMYGSDGSRERQAYNAGILVKREVLPPGLAPKTGTRRDMLTLSKANVVLGQTRDDMHRPTRLAAPQVSKYLIRRETAGLDLSAPPLKPRTAPARPHIATAEMLLDKESPFPMFSTPREAPRTAPAQTSSLAGTL
eukprot:TRINITY_DN6514_c0_g1_i1.p1 TRINITY_DN6514_c0_g1~~TRINITY_DN6514_c0_g1_i1.p1  ORF type:complete len:325 (+),score=57.80 TRINITY_DN6514_c0_g1_i1:120-1094(+)